MISREKFLESTVSAMLVERAKLSKEFWQIEGGELVKMADYAYRALVDAHLSDLMPGRSAGEFIQTLTTELDNMSPKTRRTLFALFRERYGEDGERR